MQKHAGDHFESWIFPEVQQGEAKRVKVTAVIDDQDEVLPQADKHVMERLSQTRAVQEKQLASLKMQACELVAQIVSQKHAQRIPSNLLQDIEPSSSQNVRQDIAEIAENIKMVKSGKRIQNNIKQTKIQRICSYILFSIDYTQNSSQQTLSLLHTWLYT